MAATDEDALICDFAETYHVFDYMSLPSEMAATLAAGLRPDSRIRMKQSNLRDRMPGVALLSMCVDELRLLRWSGTKDGRKGRNAPPLLANMLSEGPKTDEYRAYKTGTDFERDRARILALIKEGETNG